MKLVKVVLLSDFFNLLLWVAVLWATTSIKKDSQGVGSEFPAWAGEGCGFQSLRWAHNRCSINICWKKMNA